MAQRWLRFGSDLVQVWLSSTDTPSFDDTFFPVVCFSAGFTHRPWAWQSHVAIAFVGSALVHWLHTHRPRVWTHGLHPRTGRGRGRVRWFCLHSHGRRHMEDPQGGVGKLEGADDREDSPVRLDACVRGPVPRLHQAQCFFGPVVVRNQSWFRLGSMVAPVLFSFAS